MSKITEPPKPIMTKLGRMCLGQIIIGRDTNMQRNPQRRSENRKRKPPAARPQAKSSSTIDRGCALATMAAISTRRAVSFIQHRVGSAAAIFEIDLGSFDHGSRSIPRRFLKLMRDRPGVGL